MAEGTLTPSQRRAAGLLAQGRQQRETAKELGVSPKTVQRWTKRDDFRTLVRQQRRGMVDEVPTAENVLGGALTATKKDGSPDWQVRVVAARALMSSPVASPDAEEKARESIRETRIYLPPPESDA